MTSTTEDVYSTDSELRRALSTFQNRINLWNYGERIIDREYRPKTIKDIKVNIRDRDEVDRWVLGNNSRIDAIRKLLTTRSASQRAKLNVSLEEIE